MTESIASGEQAAQVNQLGSRLSGVFTALVTPFKPSGEVDYERFEELAERQLQNGVVGLVPCGTTGETPTLTAHEQAELIRRCVSISSGKHYVLAGTGSNSTQATIEYSKAAEAAGVDGLLVVMPYYNKPSQLGLVQHIEQVAKATALPIVLYNIPGRTGVELEVASILTLLDRCPNVLGVKDATGNVLSCQALLAKAGDRVSVLCGDDCLSVPMMSVGAKGVVSVSSNALPARVSRVIQAALAGDWALAQREHLALLDFHQAMFLEPNPAPVKAALAYLGYGEAYLRSPLVAATPGVVAQVENIIQSLGEI